MSADWDEIRKLASDFQNIQITSSLQKLSERNCVEIVTLLTEMKLVDVIFTVDGKEYITPEHVEKEIIDEMYVNGGRINLAELSKTLNIDFAKINPIAEKIAAKNRNIHLMLGQLINEEYITQIAKEINGKLIQYGEISVSDLTIQYDLPTDFLQERIINKNLGKIIHGRQDPSNPRVIFTQVYVSRCKAKINGALAAITRPTPISTILQIIQIPEKMFHSLIDEVAPAGTVTSKLSNAQYIPNIYYQMQTDWVNAFFKQNGFIEYETATKLGIIDPKQFIKKHFPNEDIIYLDRYAIGSKITDLRMLSALNECNLTKSYVDLTTILPTNMSDDDIEELFTYLLKTEKIPKNCFVFLESTVFTNQFLNDLIQPCKDLAIENARKSIESGVYQQYVIEKQLNSARNIDQDFDHFDSKTEKREERRRKAASGKGGGGTQGRETKTKAVKKHQRGGGGGNQRAGDDDSDDNFNERSSKRSVKPLTLVTLKEIEKIISKKLEDEGLEHLATQIAKLNHETINQLALTTAQNLFESTPQTNRRQTHAALQEKLNTLLVDIRLYEKGLKVFPSDTQSQLVKYLLKSLGTDICNEVCLYVANECNLNYKTASLTPEQRNKILQECENEYKSTLTELNKSLVKGSVDEFLLAAENALKSCSMVIKKIDKKKDRSLILQHKEKLCQQIKETEDPAIILHLAVLILFTTVTGNIIHASGRFVFHLLTFLQNHLNQQQHLLLKQYHDLVLKHLSGPGNDENPESDVDILDKLKEMHKDICELAINYEKHGNTKSVD